MVQRMKPAGDRDYMGNRRVALTIIGGWEMITEVGEIANDALVEVGELLFSEGVAVESRRIGTSFK